MRGTISFQVNATSGCTIATIIQDTLEENPETFNVTLGVPNNIYKEGSITAAVITIIDDDGEELSFKVFFGEKILSLIREGFKKSQMYMNIQDRK